MTIIPLPRWTPDAKKRWDEVPEWARRSILDFNWCSHCGAGKPMQVREARMIGRTLLLKGVCKVCEGEVARIIEPEED